MSPALGLTLIEEEMFFLRPPHQRPWSEAIEQGRMTKPSYLAVCAGELDGGSCSPIMVRTFCELMNVDQVKIMPEQGHQLDRLIVQAVIGEFLS